MCIFEDIIFSLANYLRSNEIRRYPLSVNYNKAYANNPIRVLETFPRMTFYYYLVHGKLHQGKFEIPQYFAFFVRQGKVLVNKEIIHARAIVLYSNNIMRTNNHNTVV